MTIIRVPNLDANLDESGVPKTFCFGGEKETRRWKVGYSSMGDLPLPSSMPVHKIAPPPLLSKRGGVPPKLTIIRVPNLDANLADLVFPKRFVLVAKKRCVGGGRVFIYG